MSSLDSFEESFGLFANHVKRGMPINPTKRAARHSLLASYPELRLRINFAPLHRILGFTVIKCYRASSVALDLAIRGSDIDGGLVVMNEPAELDRQQAFVDELRGQGFDVCHPNEVAALEPVPFKLERYLGDIVHKNGIDFTPTIRDDNVVRFHTDDELQRMGSQFTNAAVIYAQGYALPEQRA